MSLDPKIAFAIQQRINSIREWMADEAPYATVEQRHLDPHTPERAYWHYGYQAALNDVLVLGERDPTKTHDSPGRDSST
jgi:hypothetical protein